MLCCSLAEDWLPGSSRAALRSVGAVPDTMERLPAHINALPDSITGQWKRCAVPCI